MNTARQAAGSSTFWKIRRHQVFWFNGKRYCKVGAKHAMDEKGANKRFTDAMIVTIR